MIKLIFICVFLIFRFSFGQEFINDALTNYFGNASNRPVLGITILNDTVWALGYGSLVRNIDSTFEKFWLDSDSKGNLLYFTDSNNFNIWENITSNDNAICLYMDDTTKLSFLIISNNFVRNVNLIKDEISFASNVNLDENNKIWFVGNYKNDTKPAICYLMNDSLYTFSMKLPDSLIDYRVNKLFIKKSDKFVVLSKFGKDFIMNSFVLKIDSLNNYTYLNFPSHKQNNNGHITYNFYSDKKTLYILNNYSDLLILDSDIKNLNIKEEYLGECFSFVAINNSIYYGYTETNTEINLTEFDLINSDKKSYSKPYSFNRGVGYMLLFKDIIIGLSGPCYQWNGEIFKFKYK